MTSQRHLKYFQVLLKEKTYAQWVGLHLSSVYCGAAHYFAQSDKKKTSLRETFFGKTFPCRRNLNTFIRLEFCSTS